MAKSEKKEKKPLNIAQRVEILLREGVESTAWYGVEGYKEKDCVGGDAWESEHNVLYKHHQHEVAFLKQIVKELCEQVKALDEQLDKDVLGKGTKVAS